MFAIKRKNSFVFKLASKVYPKYVYNVKKMSTYNTYILYYMFICSCWRNICNKMKYCSPADAQIWNSQLRIQSRTKVSYLKTPNVVFLGWEKFLSKLIFYSSILLYQVTRSWQIKLLKKTIRIFSRLDIKKKYVQNYSKVKPYESCLILCNILSCKIVDSDWLRDN